MKPASYPSGIYQPSLAGLPPRPFLKWAGGKARLIEQYQPHFPTAFEAYHEPFLGGGALFFHLAPGLIEHHKAAYLSDLNPELVNVYRCVRDQIDGLIDRLEAHRAAHCETYYYAIRVAADGPFLPLMRDAPLARVLNAPAEIDLPRCS